MSSLDAGADSTDATSLPVPLAPSLREAVADTDESRRNFMVNLKALDGILPDAAAKIDRMARHRGVPVSLVIGKQTEFNRADEAERLASVLSEKTEGGEPRHPVSMEWFNDPLNMAKAKDDVHSLLAIENNAKERLLDEDMRSQVNHLRTVGLSMGPDYLRYVIERVPYGGSAVRALGTMKSAMSLKKLRNGEATDADKFDLQRELARDYFETTRANFADQVVDVVSNLPAFGAEFATTGGAYSAGRRLLARAGEGALTRWSGRLIGSAAQTSANPAFVADRIANRLNTAPDEGFAEAMSKGFGDAFIEMASERAGGILERLPGVHQVSRWLKTAIADRWLAKRPGATLDQFFDVLNKAGYQGVLGEIMEERVGDVARAATGIQSLPYNSPKELLQQMLVEGAAFSMMPLAGVGAHIALNRPHPADRLVEGLHKLATHEAEAARLDKAVQLTSASKLTQRDADGMQQFTQAVEQNNGLQSEVYADARSVQAVFQQANEADPAAGWVAFQEFARAVGPEGLTDAQVDEALQTGGTLTIRTAPYLAKYAGQLHNQIKGLISFDPSMEVTTDTLAEKQKALQQQVDDLKGYADALRQQQDMPQELLAVRKQMLLPREQGGMGETAIAADSYLTEVRKIFQRLTERTGVSFNDLWSRYGGAFEIKVGDTPEAVRERAQAAIVGVAAQVREQTQATSLGNDELRFQDERNKAIPVRLVKTVSEAEDRALEFVGKEITNADDGLVATVSKTNIGKMASEKATKKSVSPEVHANALANADILFENSIEDPSMRAPHKKGSPDIKAVRRYWSPMVYGKEIFAVKITVKETVRQGNRIYSIEAIDVEKAKPAWYVPAEAGVARGEPEGSASPPHAGSQEKLRRKFGIVNQSQNGVSSGNSPRGALETTATGKKIVHLFKTADRSTFIHEMFHLYLRMTDRLIADGMATEELKNDLRVLRESVGWKEGALTKAQEEKMARVWEAYHMPKDGETTAKAPSTDLMGAFARFGEWMRQIYRSVKDMGVEVNDDVRQVFDRMLASEDEVDAARYAYGQGDEIRQIYEKDQAKLADWKRRKDELRRNQVSRQVRMALRAYFQAVGGRTGVEKQMTKEVAAMPIYAVLKDKSGISAEDVQAQFGQEMSKTLQERFPGAVRVGGKSIARLATEHGFAGPEALAESLKTAVPEAEAVKQRTDAAIKETEARIRADAEAGGDAGTRAVHSEESLAVLASEAQMLADEIGRLTKRRPDQMTNAVYRAEAQRIISGKTVAEAIRYASFAAQERKHGRRVIELLRRARGETRGTGDAEVRQAQQSLAEERAWQKVDDGTFGDVEVAVIAGKQTEWTAETAIFRLQERLAVDRQTAWMIYNAAVSDTAEATAPVKVADLLRAASDYIRENQQGTLAERLTAREMQQGQAEMDRQVAGMRSEAALPFGEAIIASGGLLSVSAAEASGEPLVGELRIALEGKKVPGLVRNDAPKLDILRSNLWDRGYRFETPAEMLDAIKTWLATGKEPTFSGYTGESEAQAMFQSESTMATDADQAEKNAVEPSEADRAAHRRMLTDEQQAELLQQALEARKLQLLNHALVTESMRVREEVQAVENRYKPSKIQAALKGLENAFVDPVLTLLRRYGFTMTPPEAEFNFAGIGVLDEDLAAMVPGWIVRGDKAGFWKHTLSVSQLREFDDFARSLLASGRDAMFSLEQKAFATATEFANRCIERLAKLPVLNVPQKGDKLLGSQWAGDKWVKFHQFLRRVIDSASHAQFVTEAADGREGTKTGHLGPNRTLYEEAVKREVEEFTHNGEVMKMLAPHLDVFAKALDRIEKENGKFFEIPDLDLGEQARRVGESRWTGEKLVAFLLNVGNEGSLSGLLAGYNWAGREVHQVSKFFDPHELQAIQGAWDTINTLFPKLDAVFFRLYNRHLPKVQAKPITLTARDGSAVTLAGGYYPKKFDWRLSDKATRFAEEDINRKQAVFRVDTKPEQGMTKARVGSVMPIRLSMGVLIEHITDTTHFIHQAEVLRDWHRLLSDGPWKTAFVERFGEGAWGRMKAWASHQANPFPIESPAADPTVSGLERFIEWNRKMAQIAILGWNYKSAAVQKTALINAGYSMGWKWIWRGYREMGVGGMGTALIGWKGEVWRKITEKSERMKQRDSTVDRDLREMVAKIRPFRAKSIKFAGREITLKDVQEMAFFMLQAMDRSVIAPIWLGAYAKHMQTMADRTKTPQQQEADAVAYADRMISDTQPSGLRAELNSIQRDPRAWIRFITMFSSWSFKQGSRYYYENHAWRNGQISTAQYANHIFHEVMFLTLATTLLRAAMRGEMPDWLDELFGLVDQGLSWFPYLSSIPRGLFTGRWDLDRAVPATEGIKRAQKAVWSAFDEDKEWHEALWDVARFGEFAAGVPVTNIPKDLQRMFEKKD